MGDMIADDVASHPPLHLTNDVHYAGLRSASSISFCGSIVQLKNHMEDDRLAFFAITVAAIGLSGLLVLSSFRTWVHHLFTYL